ncbi:CBS domain-containing protein [Actinoplanes philippinensis]|uniref:CBS domain-containing protein n=1 Tax=Actinoplanes philippinensis TaxID=35752 RepID=A0A1I2E964_9ACTN|nr:CBS domain-containing protein [Actinoplanes philippinensis]
MTDTRRPSSQELLALKGKTLRVTDLLAMFGERARNFHNVPVIERALQEAGLDTHPSFTTCGLATRMLVIAHNIGPAGEEEADEEVQPGILPQQSFKIGDIPSARGGVFSVKSTAPLHTATYTMRQKNYSQIPVIDGMAEIKGVITWSSIAARYEKGEVPTLANAMVQDSIPMAEVHHDLFSRLPELRQYGYLLVRDNNGIFVGIITGDDITGQFHTLALPFFLVGEIESRLRLCLGPKLTGDPVRALKGPNHSGDFSKLMFGEYIKLLSGDQQNAGLRACADTNWASLGWGVDRTQFVAQLDRVRIIRNQIAHFDEEPLSPHEIDELREFSGLLKQLL